MPASLTPTQAAYIATLARKALRAGLLSHHAYAVLDALLWSARKPGSDRAVASYSRLEALAHVARGTVAKAIDQLEALNLLARVKRRVLVVWNNGGRRWRQRPNEYVFCCEFTPQGEYQKEETLILTRGVEAPEIRAAQAALDARRRAIEEKMLGKGCRRPALVHKSADERGAVALAAFQAMR